MEGAEVLEIEAVLGCAPSTPSTVRLGAVPLPSLSFGCGFSMAAIWLRVIAGVAPAVIAEPMISVSEPVLSESGSYLDNSECSCNS